MRQTQEVQTYNHSWSEWLELPDDVVVLKGSKVIRTIRNQLLRFVKNDVMSIQLQKQRKPEVEGNTN